MYKKLFAGIFTALMLPGQAAMAADTAMTRDCNLLGREIALRAAEELDLELDAAARTQLAAIAENTCLANPAPQAMAAPPVAASPQTAAEADDDGSLFDLQIIEPEDRVRRGGLKRR